MELNGDVHERVRELCAEGDALAEEGDHQEAADCYWTALELLPGPKTRWEASTHILVAIGDLNFAAGELEAARESLELARHCPGADGHALLHLRLGQCLLDQGEPDRAAAELARAHALAGSEIFEDEDGRYLAFLMTRVEAPPEGW